MSTISQAGGIIYIRQSGNSIQYQRNSTSGAWTIISSWPATFTNTTPASGTVLTVRLFTNITISTATVGTGTNGYFIMGSQYITFDGNNNTVTISAVTNYPGLIRNGTGTANGQANVTVQNVGVSSSSSTLANNAAWICQQYFSNAVNNNIVTNCYSSGVISGTDSGGICGAYAAATGGRMTITNCYSTGVISSTNNGGICGAYAGRNGGSVGSVTITACYSTGAISGLQSGGICGGLAGQTGAATITNCYSMGTISGSSSGGICGYGAATPSGTATITNCYSYGNFSTITNIYIPGMVGFDSVTTGISNYYVARGTWSDVNANTIGRDANGRATGLTGTPTSFYVNNPGTTWTSTATNTPYILSGDINSMYNPNSYTNPSGIYTYTSSPGLYSGNYRIISVNNAEPPSSITVNYSTGALSFNFSSDTYSIFNVLVLVSLVTTPPYSGYYIGTFTLNQLCFNEGSKILYLNPETNAEEYIKIENLRKGDLVKTLLSGYKPISNIGYSTMFNKVDEERTKDKLYKCEQTEYPEVFEPLVITGCHSVLVDYLKDETAWNKTCEICNGNVYMTDGKYRLPACVDERANIYEVEGTHKIYHLALEHYDYDMNYGIYANGLLVETTSNRMMDHYGMKLL